MKMVNIVVNPDIDVSDSSSSLEDKLYIRVSTAPARPLNELEEFKRSTEFFVLEQIMLCSAQLIHKDYEKLDLDSVEGQRICKKYMGLIEKLCEVIIFLFRSMMSPLLPESIGKNFQRPTKSFIKKEIFVT